MRPTESTRALPVWMLALLALLLIARAATAFWEHRNPAKPFERVGWLAPAAAIEAAAVHRRPILYDFTAEWCGPCKRLNAEVFSDRNAAGQISGMFVPARVVDRTREEGANPAIVDSLQRRHDITGFPTLLVVGADGREAGRVLGYPGPGATMDSLRAFYQRARIQDLQTPVRLGS
jgi:thiol:disulfide interchange protein